MVGFAAGGFCYKFWTDRSRLATRAFCVKPAASLPAQPSAAESFYGLNALLLARCKG